MDQGFENHSTVSNIIIPGPSQTIQQETVQTNNIGDNNKDTGDQDQQNRKPNGADKDLERRVEDYLNNLKKSYLEKGYTPVERGIHHQSSIDFYQKELNANQEVLDILKNGYEVTFADNKLPERVHLENNRSAIEDLEFCQEQVAQWIEEGFVEEAEEVPTFINPLSVSTKISTADASTRKRLCLDLSRSLNCLVVKKSAPMEDLPKLFDR